jgi:hypothetical protein
LNLAIFHFVFSNVHFLDAMRGTAYLDPGTGSLVTQLILAGLLGAGFFIRLFWKNIRAFFQRLFKQQNEAGDGDPFK